MFVRRNSELVVENVISDFLREIPVRDDTVLDGILQCQDIAVRIEDDLLTSQASISLGTAGDDLARGLDVQEHVIMVQGRS